MYALWYKVYKPFDHYRRPCPPSGRSNTSEIFWLRVTPLSQIDLILQVAELTFVLWRWLDVSFTREDCGISALRVKPPSTSDHVLLHYITLHYYPSELSPRGPSGRWQG